MTAYSPYLQHNDAINTQTDSDVTKRDIIDLVKQVQLQFSCTRHMRSTASNRGPSCGVLKDGTIATDEITPGRRNRKRIFDRHRDGQYEHSDDQLIKFASLSQLGHCKMGWPNTGPARGSQTAQLSQYRSLRALSDSCTRLEQLGHPLDLTIAVLSEQ